MIFTGLHALQCWALSTVPSEPGVFPSKNLYANMDYVSSFKEPQWRRYGGSNPALSLACVVHLGSKKRKNYLMVEIFLLWTQQSLHLRNATFGSLPTKMTHGKLLRNSHQTTKLRSIYSSSPQMVYGHDKTTSGVDWILNLQDGAIDLLGLQDGQKEN